MNLTKLPIAEALFAQWRRARGDPGKESQRAFFRQWETLLEDAGLLSATERNEAERDAHELEKEGWIDLKPVAYRPHLIERISIPLAAEMRWREAFGFSPPSDEETRMIRGYPWTPELAFLRASRISLPFDDLRLLDQYLATPNSNRLVVPIKERSLQIFGDEKRLDALVDSSLFASGRLSLDRLSCEIVGEPLAWKRGPVAASAEPILVIENAATWHSYVHWNQRRPQFSAVVYGSGNRFIDGVASLAEIFHELGGARRILYFGDLDPQGLRIPQEASSRAEFLSLGRVEPHLWSYRQLLTFGISGSQPVDTDAFADAEQFVSWLGEIEEPVRRLFASHCRLAQEHIGAEYLAAF
jgi:hypothetical protein